MKMDRIAEHDPDLHPDWWKKCGACPTLLPIDPSFDWKSQNWHRTINGAELCGECSEAVMDAEQEAAEAAEAANLSAMEALR